MRRRLGFRVVSALIILACLIPAGIVHAQTKPPLLQIGRADAVEVDGRFGEREWVGTSRVSVFAGSKGAPAGAGATMRVCWNDTGLMVAWEIEGRPTAERRGRDGEIWADDAVEIRLSPGDGHSEYTFGLSAVGSLYDARDGDSAWDVLWRAVPMVGATQWRAEMQIPFAAVGSGAPSPGDVWRADFRLHRASDDVPAASWAPMADAGDHPLGFLRFASAPSPVLLSAVTISGGTASITPVVTPGASIRAVLLQGDIHCETVERAESAPFEVSLDRPGDYRLRLVGVASDGELVLQRELPLTRRPPIALSATTRMLERREAKLSIDARGLATTPELFTVSVEGGPTAEIAGGSKIVEGVVDLTDAAAGPIALKVTARARGTDLASATLDIELPERPPWAGNRLGRHGRLMAPWKPVRTREHAVQCDHCAYDFQDRLLPAGIRVLGEELLADPVELQVRAGDGRSEWSRVIFRWTETTDTHATAVISASSDVAEARIGATCSFDGLMTFNIAVEPLGDRALEQVKVEIPLTGLHANLLQIADGSAGNLVASRTPRGRSARGFAPLVWLTGDSRGLQWLCGSSRGWQVEDPEESIVVQRGRGETRLTVTMLDSPLPERAAFETGFALQPTPVRRSGEEMQRHIATVGESLIGEGGCDTDTLSDLRASGVKNVVLDDPRFRPRPDGLGPERDGQLRQLVTACHEMGLGLMLAVDNDISGAWWERYRDEVVVKASGDDGEGAPAMGCPGGPWADYVVAAVADALDRYEIDGIHLRAGATPLRCASALHGCAAGGEGAVSPTWDVPGTRELIRRLRTVVSERTEAGIVTAECPAGTFAPTLACVDGLLLSAVDEEGEPRTPDELSALGAQGALGVPVEIAVPAPEREQAFGAALALGLLHDAGLRPVAEAAATVSRVWAAQEDFVTAGARWYPSGSSDSPVRVESTAVDVAAWTRHGRALAVVANHTADRQVVELTVDRETLRVGNRLHAEDMLTGRRVRQIGDVLRARLDAWQTKLLWIRSDTTEAAN